MGICPMEVFSPLTESKDWVLEDFVVVDRAIRERGKEEEGIERGKREIRRAPLGEVI